jgi:hypothetical protein
VDPVPDPLLLRKFGSSGNPNRIFESVARKEEKIQKHLPESNPVRTAGTVLVLVFLIPYGYKGYNKVKSKLTSGPNVENIFHSAICNR